MQELKSPLANDIIAQFAKPKVDKNKGAMLDQNMTKL